MFSSRIHASDPVDKSGAGARPGVTKLSRILRAFPKTGTGLQAKQLIFQDPPKLDRFLHL
jgi:hypothetical protein